MWAVIIVLFFASKAFADGVEAVDCERSAHSVCSPEKARMAFPENENELNALCPVIIKNTKCLNNHDEVCATKEEDEFMRAFQPGQYKKVEVILEDICSNSTLLHKVLSDNLGCIKTTAQSTEETCVPKRSLLRKTYIAQREVDYESESTDELRKFQCLLTIQMMSCVTENISQRCGDMAKSAVLEVIFRASILQSERCPAEVSSDMADLLSSLELPSEHKQEMKDFLQTYLAWSETK